MGVTEIEKARAEGDWEEFLTYYHSLEDLTSLLRDPEIKWEYQDRALQIVLAPNLKALPFSVPSSNNRASYLPSSVTPEYPVKELMGDLNQQQAIRAAEIIRSNMTSLRKGGYGIEDHLVYYSARELNSCIINLLPVLPNEAQDEIFMHFEIDESRFTPNANENDDMRYGYMALEELYMSPNVPERFKLDAAAEMHAIIGYENIQKTPKEKHINRTIYSHILRSMAEVDKLPLSEKFYAGEIKYLMQVFPEDQVVIDALYQVQEVEKITRQLEGEQILRYKFIRRNLLGKTESGNPPNVFVDKERLPFVRQVINDYPEDKGMVYLLNSKVEIYEQKRQKSELSTNWWNRKRQEALEKLKK